MICARCALVVGMVSLKVKLAMKVINSSLKSEEGVRTTSRPNQTLHSLGGRVKPTVRIHSAIAALSLPYWRRRMSRDVHSIRDHSHGTDCGASMAMRVP